MQFARKFGVVLILLAMLLFVLSQTGIFKGDTDSSPRKAPNNTSSSPSEPRFRHDGDVWVIDSLTGDTLLLLPMETAKSQEEIQYGMMFRKSYNPDFYGMLFFMPQEKKQSFWMRNTYLPLDIVYVNNKKEIVSIVRNASPLSDRSLPSETPALYVLELPGGFTISKDINPGDKVNWNEIPI